MAKTIFHVSAAQMIQSRREDVASATKNLRTMRANRAALSRSARVVNRIVSLGKTLSDNCDAYVYASVAWDDSVRIRGSITVGNMLSLTGPTIGKLVQAMRTAGFDRCGEPEKHADQYNANMTIEFRRESDGIRTDIPLRFELAEDGTDGATCKKVQVGVELREVPKFEIVCS